MIFKHIAVIHSHISFSELFILKFSTNFENFSQKNISNVCNDLATEELFFLNLILNVDFILLRNVD